MAPKIDHIIVGLPYAELQNPPEWLTKHFTLTPGGRHADNKTENKLIVFRDGSYIELIAFINDDPEKKKGHWWGEHGSGFIDWAFTSSNVDDITTIRHQIQDANVGIDARYDEPRSGGRHKPDGVEIQWKVTFPENVRRGEVPFWCHDITPRELRVPKDIIATTHPCGAVGVGQLTLLVPEPKLSPFKKLYSAVIGKTPAENNGTADWEIEAPIEDSTLVKPVVVLETPKLSFEKNKLKGQYAVISEIALLTDTIGVGQSRDVIIETLGGDEVCINFLHGKQA